MPEQREDDVAIEVEHLVKRFARSPRNAVDDVSFSVRRGETFGLLGPNGAGKTTTIGVLTTRVRPSGGVARISGLDVAKDTIGVRQRIAVTPQRSNLDRSLRVGEILTYHAAYHGVGRKEREARAQELLEEFGLGARAKQQLSIFSGGMEQRVLLARALMHDPDALFLDEPTNNLDPQARLFLWERIRALHDQGVTIVLTTHDMDEADRLCDRIAIMDHGRILALDTPEGLRRLIPGGTVLEIAVRVPQVALIGQSGDGETGVRLIASSPRSNGCLASRQWSRWRARRRMRARWGMCSTASMPRRTPARCWRAPPRRSFRSKVNCSICAWRDQAWRMSSFT